MYLISPLQSAGFKRPVFGFVEGFLRASISQIINSKMPIKRALYNAKSLYMNVIHISEKTIYGLSARTNNENEMNPTSGKIAHLVTQFDQSVKVNYQAGARVYSVYYDYESDASGDYTVLVGADNVESSRVELEDVQILEGNYLVFSGSGQVPQIVFETWAKVWSYFSSENCAHTRAYSTDFEFYKNQSEIEIHIAIK